MRIFAGLLALAIAALAPGAGAGVLPPSMVDPGDGKLDLSEWLLDRSGFLPVPIIITEPALGTGGGAALLFFDQSIKSANARREGDTGPQRLVPPNITGGAAFKTSNGSWGAFAGGFRVYENDDYRVGAAIGKISFNLDFYGDGPLSALLKNPLRYNLEGEGAGIQGQARILKSDWFAGLRYFYGQATASHVRTGEVSTSLPLPTPDRGVEFKNGSLGAMLHYDSRDNIFTPSHGDYLGLEAMFFEPAFGSTDSFRVLRAFNFNYLPLGEDFVLGTRLDSEFTSGEVPFYALPYIKLRGIPAMRYQGQNAVEVEVELRWNVDKRWALVFFGGAGRAYGERISFSEATTETTKGIGLRYLTARKLGMYTGFDFAWGPEQRVFYIQVGSAWR